MIKHIHKLLLVIDVSVSGMSNYNISLDIHQYRHVPSESSQKLIKSLDRTFTKTSPVRPGRRSSWRRFRSASPLSSTSRRHYLVQEGMMHIHKYACIYIYIHVYIYTLYIHILYIYIYIYVYMYVHIYNLHLHVFVLKYFIYYIYIYMYIIMYICLVLQGIIDQQ